MAFFLQNKLTETNKVQKLTKLLLKQEHFRKLIIKRENPKTVQREEICFILKVTYRVTRLEIFQRKFLFYSLYR